MESPLIKKDRHNDMKKKCVFLEKSIIILCGYVVVTTRNEEAAVTEYIAILVSKSMTK